MPQIRLMAGGLVFAARLEEDLAPNTCAVLKGLLPLRAKIVQARWSGQALWIPLGESLDLQGLGRENATSTPAPGQLLLYPGGISEQEVLVPYGVTRFACVDGPLEGNHFATITEGAADLPTLGNQILWQGAQDVALDLL